VWVLVKISVKDVVMNIVFSLIGITSIIVGILTKDHSFVFFRYFFISIGILLILYAILDFLEVKKKKNKLSLLNEHYNNKDELSLIKMAKNEKDEIQERSIRYLGALKSKKAIEPLKDIIMKSKERDVQILAIQTLSLIGGNEIEGFLLEVLEDEEFNDIIFEIAFEHMKIKGIESLGYEKLEKLKVDDELDEWDEAEFDELVKNLRIFEQIKENFKNKQDVLMAIDEISDKKSKQLVIEFIKNQEQNLISLQEIKAKNEQFIDVKQKMTNEISRIIEIMGKTKDSEEIERFSNSIEKLQNSFYKQKEFFWRYGWGRVILEVLIGIILAIVGGLVGKYIG